MNVGIKLSENTVAPKEEKESYEERRRRLLAPLPIIYITTSPRGNSQAPNQTLVHTHIEDGEY